MASQQQLNTEFSRVFFNDIVDLYPQSQRQYACTGISDIHYCQLGVLRCLSSSVTGQEFLQYHADQNVAKIEPSHFFKALQSERRLENIISLNDMIATPMIQHVADPYAQCSELDDWAFMPWMDITTRPRVSTQSMWPPMANSELRQPGIFFE